MIISVKTSKVENNQNGVVGLATVSFGDAFKVQSIAIKQSHEGKLFVAMPSYKSKQVDEEGKPVYKEICFPANKEFRDALRSQVVNEYLENMVGINKPIEAAPTKEAQPSDGFMNIPDDEELPFADAVEESAKTKPQKEQIDTLIKDTAEKLSADKGKKEHKAEVKKPSIKDRMASGEAKKKANEAKKAAEPKLPKTKEAEIA